MATMRVCKEPVDPALSYLGIRMGKDALEIHRAALKVSFGGKHLTVHKGTEKKVLLRRKQKLVHTGRTASREVWSSLLWAKLLQGLSLDDSDNPS